MEDTCLVCSKVQSLITHSTVPVSPKKKKTLNKIIYQLPINYSHSIYLHHSFLEKVTLLLILNEKQIVYFS